MKHTAYFCHNFAEIFKSNEYEKIKFNSNVCYFAKRNRS